MRKLLIAALAVLSSPALALESGPVVSVYNNRFTQVPMTQAGVFGQFLTRPANTTAYAAGQLVCGTTCAPLQIKAAPEAAGEMLLTRVSLLKSGTAATNASFTLWLYAQPPTLTGLSDQSAYVGPYAADFPYYLGAAVCATANATNDATAQRWFECSMNNPNFTGVLNLTAWANSRLIYGVISTNAAYTPSSGETFTPYLSGQY